MFNIISGILNIADLRKKFMYTLGMVILFRMGSHIPVAGVDPAKLANLFSKGNILGFLDLFTGGALMRFSIFAMGIIPFINASIIMQLMTSISPQMAQLKKDGESGRKTINQYTRYLTVLLATVQAYGFAVALEGTSGSAGSIVLNPGVFFKVTSFAPRFLGGRDVVFL